MMAIDHRALMQRRSLLLGAAGLALSTALPVRAQAPAPALRVWGGEVAGDQRAEFALELLRQALAAAGIGADLQPAPGLSQRRMRRALRDRSLDVALLPSLGLADGPLLPVRFPLRRGLLGLRLLLVRAGEEAAFARITSIEGLQRLRMGIGEDWAEREPLQRLGFRTVPVQGYAKLFDALRAGRCDYLTRSVAEVWSELDRADLAGHGLALVPRRAMFYPLDDYFVVADPALAAQLGAALLAYFDSDDYWALFNRHFGEQLQRTALSERKILNVSGFGVDAGTPLDLFDVVHLQPMRGEFRVPASL
jgi:hypothetical protein